MKKENLLPLNLQFFAEEGDNSGSSDNNANDNQNNGNDGGSQNDQTDNSGEKTFTQSQVSAMMTKEKNEGRKAMLKSLGFESEKDAKDAFALLNALKDSQKSAEEKAEDFKNKAAKDLSEANARANAAESKLTCLENGVNKESLADVLAIASSKISDDKDLNTVIKEMAKDKKYSSFFTNANPSGTGSNPGHSGSSSEELGDYGKKLAEKSKSATKD